MELKGRLDGVDTKHVILPVFGESTSILPLIGDRAGPVGVESGITTPVSTVL